MDPSSASSLEDDDSDQLSSLLLGARGWDCPGCPPPYFDLPPPPKPPFMQDDSDDCGDDSGVVKSPYESCDSLKPIFVDSGYDDEMVDVAVAAAVAVVVVAFVILAACFVWRFVYYTANEP